MVESTAVFLYGLFIEEPDWCRKHGEAIKKAVGPYPAGAATKACSVVKNIASCLEPQQQQSLGEGAPVNAPKEFGLKIGFKFEANFFSPLSDGAPSSATADSLSEDELDGQPSRNTVISTLLNGLDRESCDHQVTGLDQQHPQSPAKSGYGGGWLEGVSRRIVVAGMPWQQVYSQLLDILSVDSTSSAIENDVSFSSAWLELLCVCVSGCSFPVAGGSSRLV